MKTRRLPLRSVFISVAIALAVALTLACGDESEDALDAVPPGSTQAMFLEDVAYAEQSASQTMDISIPEGEGPFPAVVYIHGGGFFTGDKESGLIYIDFLSQNGYVAISTNYRLSEEATFPAAVHDLKAAVRFLRAHAESYRIDPERIGSWGDSAGGNLASMLGTSSGDEFTEDLSMGNATFSAKVSATVDWFGPINFSTLVEEADSLGLSGFMGGGIDTDLEAAYLGLDAIEDDPELVSLADPTSYLDGEDAAFFIQAGSDDPLVPYSQSQDFYRAIVAALGSDRASFELLDGAGHGGPEFDASDNLAKVLAFFDTHLR